MNNRYKRTGTFFQKKTKAKILSMQNQDGFYPLVCFNYIHQNPWRARLCKRMEDWEFSSFRDYIGLRSGKLCDQELSTELLDLPRTNKQLYQMSYDLIDEALLESIF